MVLGMITENWIASKLEILGAGDYDEISELLQEYGDRLAWATEVPTLNKQSLYRLALADKKNTKSSIIDHVTDESR